jgi:TRAP-type C4-dicarboxylate transport system permease small subunit
MAAMLALMAVLVFGNVVLRYGFNFGITVSEELARFLFVWLAFIGAILALKEGEHLGVDTLVCSVSLAKRKLLYGLSAVLMLVCCAVLLKGAWVQTMINWSVPAPVTGIPMAALYGMGIVTAIGMGSIVTWNLFRLLTGRLSERELVQVHESEDGERAK